MASNSYFTLLTGTDIFISYRWSPNAKKYVANLCDHFRNRGLESYLDDNSLHKGESIPKSLALGIRRTKMFVLLVTDDLGTSTWVPRELEIAKQHGRKIVPICVGSALDKLPLNESPWNTLPDLNRLDENEAAFLAGSPSPEIAEKIDQSYTSTRRKVKAIRILFGGGLAFFLVSLVALGMAVYAVQVKNAANQETQRLNGEATQLRTEIATATEAKKAADEAAKKATDARDLAFGARDLAVTEKDTAEKDAKNARTEADKAQADQLTAETLSRRATAERLAAEARRHIRQSPQKSMLISLAALDATLNAGDPPTFASQQVLIDSLNRRGGRIFRKDQDNTVHSSVYIPASSQLLVYGEEHGELWKVGQSPQLSKRLLKACSDFEVSPGGRWAITKCAKDVMTYDLHSTAAEIEPVDNVSSALPRDPVHDPEARWLLEKGAILPPSFEEARDRKPARDPAQVSEDLIRKIERLSEEDGLSMVLESAFDRYVASPNWRWIVRDDLSPAEKVGRLDQPETIFSSSWKLYDTQSLAKDKVALPFPEGSSFLGFSKRSRWLITGTSDKRIQVHDLRGERLADGKLLAESQWEDGPVLTFSPDDQWVVANVAEDVHRIWRLGFSDSTTLGKAKIEVGSEIVFSPDSRWLAVKSASDAVSFWKLDVTKNEWKPVELVGTRVGIHRIMFSPDSRWLLVRGDIGVRLRDLTIEDEVVHEDGFAIPAFYNLGEREIEVDFSPDSAWLVTEINEPQTYSGYTLWDLKEYRLHEKPLRLNGIERATPVFSSDSHWLLFVGDISRIYNLRNILPTWDRTAGSRRSHEDSVALSPNQRWRITKGKEGPLLLWDLNSSPTDSDPFVLTGTYFGADLTRPEYLRGTSDVFSRDNRWLVTHLENNRAVLWDLQDPTRPTRAFEFQSLSQIVAFSQDARFMVTSHDSSTIRVWQLDVSANGGSYFDLPSTTSPVLFLSFNSDARWLLAKTERGEASLFDLKSRGKTSQPITDQTWVLTEDEFSGDGTWLVTKEGLARELWGTQNNPWDRSRTKLWDLSGSVPLATEFSQRILKSSFAPSSHWLLSENHNEIFLTDLRTRRSIRNWPFTRQTAQQFQYLTFAFSGNGQWFTSSEQNEFHLFDLHGPTPKRQRLTVPENTLGKPFLSPDGRWLLWASDRRGNGLLWDLTRPGSAALDIPDAFDSGNRINGRGFAMFNSEGKWLLYQNALWDLRGNTPALRSLNGPENIKGVFPVMFTSDGTWLIGLKDSYTVLWDLNASELTPQLFLKPGDRAPKDTDTSAIRRWIDYRQLTSGSPLVLDNLATIARESAGFGLTEEERRDLLLPDNQTPTSPAQPKPKRTNRKALR